MVDIEQDEHDQKLENLRDSARVMRGVVITKRRINPDDPWIEVSPAYFSDHALDANMDYTILIIPEYKAPTGMVAVYLEFWKKFLLHAKPKVTRFGLSQAAKGRNTYTISIGFKPVQLALGYDKAARKFTCELEMREDSAWAKEIQARKETIQGENLENRNVLDQPQGIGKLPAGTAGAQGGHQRQDEMAGRLRLVHRTS